MKIVGIDEVGRGCWAGPLVAGAVVLKGPIVGLRDSKKLSAKQRSALAKIVERDAMACGLGWVWPQEIDDHGLSWAVKTAMARALAKVECNYDEVIIDGNINYLAEQIATRCVVRADDTVPAVSAASIIAKVARDNYMATTAHESFPEYAFGSHVGYGTKLHVEALHKYGVTSLHRLSYKPIQRILAEV